MVDQLSPDERAVVLDELGDWDFDEARDGIVRQFLFEDFWQRCRIIIRNGPMSGIASISC